MRFPSLRPQGKRSLLAQSDTLRIFTLSFGGTEEEKREEWHVEWHEEDNQGNRATVDASGNSAFSEIWGEESI